MYRSLLNAAVRREREEHWNWRCGPDTAPPGSLVVAASTPLGGAVFHTSGWPEIDEAATSEFGAGDIAVAVSQAIEDGNRNDIVLTGLAALESPGT
jgi:hypothetical protein